MQYPVIKFLVTHKSKKWLGEVCWVTRRIILQAIYTSTSQR